MATETQEIKSQKQAKTKHEFSTPWQNSDLVLIIEDQKIHVHRVILEMTSPVLFHIFEETDSNEVPLLRTKASDFVELLRVIYPQFENKITLDNIEHIYILAEEYQIESAMNVCREYLIQVKKTTTNAMKILVTAQVCKADEACKQCYEILKGLTVAELRSDQRFKDLDEKSLRNVLLPKAERLEKCLREIQPHLVGVLNVWIKPESRCPVHYSFTETCIIPMQTRINCPACREQFVETLAEIQPKMEEKYIQDFGESANFSECGLDFDETLVYILEDMFSLLKM